MHPRRFFVFGGGKSHERVNRAAVAWAVFGGDTYAGAYGAWMVVLYMALRTHAHASVREDLLVPASKFIGDFCVDRSMRPSTLLPLGLGIGSAGRPTVKVPVGLALQYAAAAMTHVPLDKNPLVEHVRAWAAFKAVLALFDAAIPVGVDEWVDRLRAMLGVRREVIAGGVGKVVDGTVRRFAKIGHGDAVLDAVPDRAPSDAERFRYYVATKVDLGSVKASAVPLAKAMAEYADVDPVAECGLGTTYNPEENDESDPTPDVCPKSMRPYMGRFAQWQADKGEKYMRRQVSHYKLFAEFFEKHGRFPKAGSADDDYVLYRAMVVRHVRNRLSSSAHVVPVPVRMDAAYDKIAKQMAAALTLRATMYGAQSVEPSAVTSDLKTGYHKNGRARLELEHANFVAASS
jgi:hypothetical protein